MYFIFVLTCLHKYLNIKGDRQIHNIIRAQKQIQKLGYSLASYWLPKEEREVGQTE